MIKKKKQEKNILDKIKILIKSENGCCNYSINCNEIPHYCCLEPQSDLKCVYFNKENSEEEEQQHCNWFKTAVLPIDIELENEFRNEYNIETNSKQIYNKICANESCKKSFTTLKEKKEYCPDCEEKIRKEKARERNRDNKKLK